MSEQIPNDIIKDLTKARDLHQRAAADYAKCLEFNQTMSSVLARLEDAGCFRSADKVMTILLNCNPKEGTHCDNATLVSEKMKKLG